MSSSQNGVFSLLMFRHFSGLFVLSLPLLCTLLVLIRVLGHDILEMAPQRFDGGKFSADLGDFLEGAVQLVDVLEDEFETLELGQSHALLSAQRCAAVCMRRCGAVDLPEQFRPPAFPAAARSTSSQAQAARHLRLKHGLSTC